MFINLDEIFLSVFNLTQVTEDYYIVHNHFGTQHFYRFGTSLGNQSMTEHRWGSSPTGTDGDRTTQ